MNIGMFIILLIRIIIWLTFFLLVVGGITSFFAARWFYKFYTQKHLELMTRIIALEAHNKNKCHD